MWAQGCLVWDVGHRMSDVHCKNVEHVHCFPFLLAHVLLMPGAWVKKDVEGAEWSFHKLVLTAACMTPKSAGRPSAMVPVTAGVSLPTRTW